MIQSKQLDSFLITAKVFKINMSLFFNWKSHVYF